MYARGAARGGSARSHAGEAAQAAGVAAELAAEALGEAAYELGHAAYVGVGRAASAAEEAAELAGRHAGSLAISAGHGLVAAEHAAEDGLRRFGGAALGFLGRAASSAAHGAVTLAHMAEQGAEELGHLAGHELQVAAHEAQVLASGARQGLAKGAAALGHEASVLGHLVEHGVEEVAHEAGVLGRAAKEGLAHLEENVEAGAERLGREIRHDAVLARDLALQARRQAAALERGLESAAAEGAAQLGRAARRGLEALEHDAELIGSAAERAAERGAAALGRAARGLEDEAEAVRREARHLGEAFNRGYAGEDGADYSAGAASSEAPRQLAGGRQTPSHGGSAVPARAPSRGDLAAAPKLAERSKTLEPLERSRTLEFGGAAEPKRFRIAIGGAKGLRGVGASNSLAGAYAVCEVTGRGSAARLCTEVIANTSAPQWNMPGYLECSESDVLDFTVFNKEAWPNPDALLGRATLSVATFFRSPCEVDLDLDARGATLRVRAEAAGAGAGPVQQRAELPIRPRSETSAARFPNTSVSPAAEAAPVINIVRPPVASRTPTSEAKLRPEAVYGLPDGPRPGLRLRLFVRGGRGLGGVAAQAGGHQGQFVCFCGVPGRPSTRGQSRVAAGVGGPVWNFEHEIGDYLVGDTLEFAVVDTSAQANAAAAYQRAFFGGGAVIGSGTLIAEQFYPYGFDSEVTLCSPGQGICGLLRVTIAVLGDAPRPPAQRAAAAWSPRKQASPVAHSFLGAAAAAPVDASPPPPLMLPAGAVSGRALGMSPARFGSPSTASPVSVTSAGRTPNSPWPVHAPTPTVSSPAYPSPVQRYQVAFAHAAYPQTAYPVLVR